MSRLGLLLERMSRLGFPLGRVSRLGLLGRVVRRPRHRLTQGQQRAAASAPRGQHVPLKQIEQLAPRLRDTQEVSLLEVAREVQSHGLHAANVHVTLVQKTQKPAGRGHGDGDAALERLGLPLDLVALPPASVRGQRKGLALPGLLDLLDHREDAIRRGAQDCEGRAAGRCRRQRGRVARSDECTEGRAAARARVQAPRQLGDGAVLGALDEPGVEGKHLLFLQGREPPCLHLRRPRSL
mmetsp:Transcript_42441/g.120969  ORF Transcript_42441/g.120969 Transcript_42441/m.120969 type:complete len:239 (-) Transcript_42441:293-1009(-)